MRENEVPDRAESEPSTRRRQVAKVVTWGGVVALTAAVSAVVTLAVTHNTAVKENCCAYINGLNDGYALAIDRLSELLSEW
jgi:hypothetical protein